VLQPGLKTTCGLSRFVARASLWGAYLLLSVEVSPQVLRCIDDLIAIRRAVASTFAASTHHGSVARVGLVLVRIAGRGEAQRYFLGFGFGLGDSAGEKRCISRARTTRFGERL
jgi:hypothetical protein